MLLSDTGTVPCPAACLDYHAGQLVRHAQHGNATLYTRRSPAAAMEPISLNDLLTGKSTNDMSTWIAGNGTAFGELSLRDNDLRQVIRLVKQSMKGHDALRAWDDPGLAELQEVMSLWDHTFATAAVTIKAVVNEATQTRIEADFTHRPISNIASYTYHKYIVSETDKISRAL